MKRLFFLTAIIAACSGCETLVGQQHRVAETRLNSDLANIRTDLQRIEQRMDGLEADRENMHVQLAELRNESQQSDLRHNAELAAIDMQLKTQTQEQTRVRQDLAEELSGKISKIMKTQAVSAPAARTQTGYEHVVKAGQTLSEIAREYKANSAAIIKANNMKDPNDLKVGQKLFIPE